MSTAGAFLTALMQGFLAALKYLFSFKWIREIIDLVRDILAILRRKGELDDHRRRRDPTCAPKRCGVIPPDVYRRADPLIYSQRYLREQNLAVTWDNPDIQLFRDGLPIPSSSLEAGTDYEVRARIWNNSTQAPAVGLGVDFFFHDFGIGPQPITIGSDTITLPVKGAPGHPATAHSMWTTPSTPGHYCLKVQLNWADDANPRNNLGQENTNVGTASSPAVFRFPVRNEGQVPRQLELEADSYEIPDLPECKERPKKKTSDRDNPELILSKGLVPALERDADWTEARRRHGPDAHPIPPGWTVDFVPEILELDANETQILEVVITPPNGFVGEQVINVNANMGTDLAGGVTLLVKAE